MREELEEIPFRAGLCYKENKGIILPEDVPYIGMGSSHISTTMFRFLGINIFPEMAADYCNYLTNINKSKSGVLISQSGMSTETLMCADHFDSFMAIVNDEESPLGNHEKCIKRFLLHSGTEKLIPAKTYINTLLVLYLGFGFNPREVVEVINTEISYFIQQGEEIGELLYKTMKWLRKKSGPYIVGSGQNIATAHHAALVLSEVTKIPVISMSTAQYDHGFKETAKNSLVIALNHDGPEFLRTRKILNTVEKFGGKSYELSRPLVESQFSPITFSIPFFYAASYLYDRLNGSSPFTVGRKITTIEEGIVNKS